MNDATVNRIFDKLSDIKEDVNAKHTETISRISGIDEHLKSINGKNVENSNNIKVNTEDIVNVRMKLSKFIGYGAGAGGVIGIIIALIEIF